MSETHDNKRGLPLGILALTILIPLLGAVNLSSAAQALRPNLYLLQIGWSIVSFVGIIVLAKIPTRHLRSFVYPIYAFVVFLLILVLVAGTTVKGSQRWLNLGFFMLQPSELAKIAIIMVTAHYFSNYEKRGGYTLRDLIYPMNMSRPLALLLAMIGFYIKHQEKVVKAAELGEEAVTAIPSWLPWVLSAPLLLWFALAFFIFVNEREERMRRIIAPMDVIILPFGLVLIEPDLGTSLIVISIAAAQVLFIGVRKMTLFISIMGLSVMVVFGWSFLLKDYQKKRVDTFLHPEKDLQGAGYHSTQSMIAIGSGQIFGKGAGQGTQTQLSFLPENHTDFVFSVLAEEWGFVGAFLIIGLFWWLLMLVLWEAKDYKDRFAALLNVGAAAMIFWHVLINIGMVTGIMPVVGMTLPFMSYGGSSMMTMMIAIGLAVNASVWAER